MCGLGARNDYIGSSQENLIEYDNPLKPSNSAINDQNKQSFEIRFKTDATIESLVTLTIYKWQLANAVNSFVFLAA